MIHIPTWENDLQVYEITDPIPVGEWLDVVTRPGRELQTQFYDSRVVGGRYDRGHVVVLHTENDTFLFAIPHLQVLLSDDQYRALLSRTPSLSSLAGR